MLDTFRYVLEKRKPLSCLWVEMNKLFRSTGIIHAFIFHPDDTERPHPATYTTKETIVIIGMLSVPRSPMRLGALGHNNSNVFSFDLTLKSAVATFAAHTSCQDLPEIVKFRHSASAP
jgi:hypothetical protein